MIKTIIIKIIQIICLLVASVLGAIFGMIGGVIGQGQLGKLITSWFMGRGIGKVTGGLCGILIRWIDNI
jgi:hypothetical protein